MEMVREDIQMLRTKSKATSQVTFDVDFNVPDVKPDIGRMIQNKGEVTIDEIRMSDGHAFLNGNLHVDLLYVGEEDGNIHSLSAKVPFEEKLNLEGIVSGDKICLKWELEDLSIHLIHSRKINIKSIVTFFAVVDEIRGIRLPVALKEEGISVKKKPMKLLSLVIHKKDTMRQREEITLASNKPNISQILWNTVEVRALDFRPEQDAVKVKGELFVFVLYEGEDETNSLQWLEYSVPFSGAMECNGCLGEMIPNIEWSLLQQTVEVKPDVDGEERVVSVDAVLEFDMKLYQEESHEVLLDVYTPLKECVPYGKKEKLESLLVRNYAKSRIVDRIEVKETQGKILQICHSCGKVKVDKTQIVKNGIQVEGVVQMKVLYIVGNDNLPFYSMEAMIPFSHLIEARGITEESMYYLQTDLEQLSTTMVDSDEIEVKATVSLNVLVISCEEEMIIERVEVQPLDMEKIRSMPGMTIYMVKSGDTLWDISKRFYTTMEEICALNDLEDEKLYIGQPLLLVKKVEG